MRRTRRAWDHAGDRRMRDHVLQAVLRPRRATQLGGKGRQRFPEQTGQQTAAAERQVDERGDAVCFAKRQDIVFGIELVDRVAELNEIDGLGPQAIHQIVKRVRTVVGIAQVVEAAVCLPATHGVELGLPIDQVVNLHQVDDIGTEDSERILHLGHAFAPAVGPDLGCDEGIVATAKISQQVTGYPFCPAIHRRRIDHRGISIEKGFKDCAAAVTFGGPGPYIEAAPGADADGGDFFA